MWTSPPACRVPHSLTRDSGNSISGVMPLAFPRPAALASPARRVRRGGFTLIEAAMVTVVIGVGVMAMLQLLAAGTVQNDDAARTTTAMTLASNIRELSMSLAYFDKDQPANGPHTWASKEADISLYDNITDLDGDVDTWDKPEHADGWQKFSPPVDGTRKNIAGYANWEQYVKVESFGTGASQPVVPHYLDSEAVRVTVKIVRDGREVYRTSWVVCAPLSMKPPPP